METIFVAWRVASLKLSATSHLVEFGNVDNKAAREKERGEEMFSKRQESLFKSVFIWFILNSTQEITTKLFEKKCPI